MRETPGFPDRTVFQIKEKRMQIPTHHIHNVLKVFAKRLTQPEDEGARGEQWTELAVARTSVEGKRRTVINKVSNEIIGRIVRVSLQRSMDMNSDMEKTQTQLMQKDNRENEFCFNVFSETGIKTLHTVSTEEAKRYIDSGIRIKKKDDNPEYSS